MPTIRVHLTGDGAWPDLAQKVLVGKHLHLNRGDELSMVCLRGGMSSGLASVMLRIDLPNGSSLTVETSLRALYNAVMGMVAAHGEPWMQSPGTTREHALQAALQEVVRQLVDAKQRLGEPMEFDMREADFTFDQEHGQPGPGPGPGPGPHT